MPDPEPYVATYHAGQVTSVDGLVNAVGVWDSAVTVCVDDLIQSGFFLNLSWSWSGDIVVNLSSQIDVKKADPEKTMFIFGQGVGQFNIKKSNGFSETISITTKPCPQMYTTYQTTNTLAKSLAPYLKNVNNSDYDSILKQANIEKDDILFCVISADGKGATIKGPESSMKILNIFGHGSTSQSTIGSAHLVKKGDLDKLKVEIPPNSTSFGFFVSASAINPHIHELSRGCMVVFKP